MALLKSNTIIYGTANIQGQLTVGAVSSNASINTATGSLIVVGGAGISGNVYAGNIISSSTIGVGGATPSTSGSGITFPATQSASSDANTLDDYEEGTWTPIDSSGSGLTFTGVSAYYTKIGDMVFATFALTFPGSSGSALNVIGGLPFTSTTGNGMNAFNVSYTSYSPGLMAPIDASATTFTLYDTTTTNAINNTALLSKAIRGTCIYKVA